MASNGAKRSKTDHVDDHHLTTAIEKLHQAQHELDKINKEANEKIWATKKEYDQVKEPIYVRRDKITRSIPDFWLTAFLNHPWLSMRVNKEDRKIFKYMESLHVEHVKDHKKGYSITFEFLPNPFFDNPKLSKTTMYFDDGTWTSTGTTIEWKEGKGPATETMVRIGNQRPIRRTSFFEWFSDHPDHDTLLGDIEDSMAETIKDELWPNPIEHLNYEEDKEEDDSDMEGGSAPGTNDR